MEWFLPPPTDSWDRDSIEWNGQVVPVPVIPHACTVCCSPIAPDFARSTGKCGGCWRHGPPFTYTPQAGVDGVWCLTTYLSGRDRHPGTALVKASKNDRNLSQDLMATASRRCPFRSTGLVVPAPSSSLRGTRSGWLAAGAAAVLDVPVADALRRVDGGPPQRSRPRREVPRDAGELDAAYRAEFHGDLLGSEDVLLVDDVVSTGATMAASAKALKHAGAASVRVLCFAKNTTLSNLRIIQERTP